MVATDLVMAPNRSGPIGGNRSTHLETANTRRPVRKHWFPLGARTGKVTDKDVLHAAKDQLKTIMANLQAVEDHLSDRDDDKFQIKLSQTNQQSTSVSWHAVGNSIAIVAMLAMMASMLFMMQDVSHKIDSLPPSTFQSVPKEFER